VAEPAVAGTEWRGIDELARLIGAYCWVENCVFEVTGAWATRSGDGLEPALRVWCAGVSRRHGLLAGRWAERLPVRAGVDRDALVAAPVGPLAGALEGLAAAPDAGVGVATLVEVVLPCLRTVYAAHRRTAPPVSQGSVLEVLWAAQQDLAAEIGSGRALVHGSAGGLTRDAALGARLERAFAETNVFPAVPPS
jgi:hypothetical protein